MTPVKLQAAHGDEDAEERTCGACCALVEQLLATAEDIEDVADECDALLRRAAEADVTSAEPLQVMASLRSQQGRPQEALEALRQSIAAWRSRRGGRSVEPSGGGDLDTEDNEFMGEYDVSFEFRFETAKLLLELDENTDEAIDVLEELLEERDGVVDVWHLLALANHGCCNFDRALELLGHADTLNDQAGGDEGVTADLMELRAAVEDSKSRQGQHAPRHSTVYPYCDFQKRPDPLRVRPQCYSVTSGSARTLRECARSVIVYNFRKRPDPPRVRPAPRGVCPQWSPAPRVGAAPSRHSRK